MNIDQIHTRCQLEECRDGEVHCLLCGRPYPCPDILGYGVVVGPHERDYNVPWLLVPVEQANAADWETADNRRQSAAGA